MAGQEARAPITIAIVDDYDIVLAGVAHMLEPYSARVLVVELDANKPVGQPVDERPLGADHHETDPLAAGELRDGDGVGRVERDIGGESGGAGVPRRDQEPAEAGARRDGGGQRVLAAARAEDEDVDRVGH